MTQKLVPASTSGTGQTHDEAANETVVFVFVFVFYSQEVSGQVGQKYQEDGANPGLLPKFQQIQSSGDAVCAQICHSFPYSCQLLNGMDLLPPLLPFSLWKGF